MERVCDLATASSHSHPQHLAFTQTLPTRSLLAHMLCSLCFALCASVQQAGSSDARQEGRVALNPQPTTLNLEPQTPTPKP